MGKTMSQLDDLYSTHTYLLVLRLDGSEFVLCHLDDEICNDRGEQCLFRCIEDSQMMSADQMLCDYCNSFNSCRIHVKLQATHGFGK